MWVAAKLAHIEIRDYTPPPKQLTPNRFTSTRMRALQPVISKEIQLVGPPGLEPGTRWDEKADLRRGVSN